MWSRLLKEGRCAAGVRVRCPGELGWARAMVSLTDHPTNHCFLLLGSPLLLFQLQPSQSLVVLCAARSGGEPVAPHPTRPDGRPGGVSDRLSAGSHAAGMEEGGGGGA